jgi:hypothetical protein
MEILIIIVVLLSLFNFAIDYLSNKLITHNEFSIGIVTFLHHLVFSMLNLFPLILFMFINNSTLFFLLCTPNLTYKNAHSRWRYWTED